MESLCNLNLIRMVTLEALVGNRFKMRENVMWNLLETLSHVGKMFLVGSRREDEGYLC